MQKKPSLVDKVSKRIQTKINEIIPEKVHKIITTTIKQMIRGVLFGAGYITSEKNRYNTFEEREFAIKQKIEKYKKTAAAEGGVTGAGGILLGLAEFPVLIAIKIKLLFDIASMYGFNIKDYKERVFMLHIFQLAFSSQQHRRKIYLEMTNWEEKSKLLPEDINEFDWRNFQQEYRDYIDLAKMAQLIPGIGAVVGVIVNYRLLRQLGDTAMNGYRMRLAEKGLIG
ncbi:MAG: EcsC family protein, partial [Parafilimonas sp.]